jgi:hypothetical protein
MRHGEDGVVSRAGGDAGRRLLVLSQSFLTASALLDLERTARLDELSERFHIKNHDPPSLANAINWDASSRVALSSGASAASSSVPHGCGQLGQVLSPAHHLGFGTRGNTQLIGGTPSSARTLSMIART